MKNIDRCLLVFLLALILLTQTTTTEATRKPLVTAVSMIAVQDAGQQQILVLWSNGEIDEVNEIFCPILACAPCDRDGCLPKEVEPAPIGGRLP